jgi:polyisoprenoid-binding protein YceI
MQAVCKVTIFGVVLSAAVGVAVAAPSPARPAAPLSANALDTAASDVVSAADSAGFSSASPASLQGSPLSFDIDPADAARVDLSARNAPAEVPVEAIPTPTAVSSGLVGFAALAGYRMLRRLRLV